ncbi:response regulator [Paenibacillus sp. HWE-109]|uniref:response regulator transcription factor n=1 Tax=Paenibacillus sp. HWE-109 TaxID=1306526 RepID=UPI001EDF848E|nr:response regulator [Paenibacillus sp. HWE-109]UKS27969.1 response regulator [Paenibacillus sp. HWE-109]
MYKLLIADDDYEIRNGLCRYFPWDVVGFHVVGSVENGKEALDFIKRHDVDVILCDIKMPIMSGIELASELSSLNSKVNIIFFSAYKDFIYAQKALENGVRRYILKSTNYQELIQAFTHIKEELDQQHHSAAKQGQDMSGKIIATIKAHVATHYRDATLEELAKLVHMNPDYLSKFFKKNAGMLFSEYLTHVRMEQAANYLNDIQYKTYEISDMVGYSNSFNFTRAFKNYFGMTPRDFRNQKDGSEHLESSFE